MGAAEASGPSGVCVLGGGVRLCHVFQVGGKEDIRRCSQILSETWRLSTGRDGLSFAGGAPAPWVLGVWRVTLPGMLCCGSGQQLTSYRRRVSLVNALLWERCWIRDA